MLCVTLYDEDSLMTARICFNCFLASGAELHVCVNRATGDRVTPENTAITPWKLLRSQRLCSTAIRYCSAFTLYKPHEIDDTTTTTTPTTTTTTTISTTTTTTAKNNNNNKKQQQQ